MFKTEFSQGRVFSGLQLDSMINSWEDFSHSVLTFAGLGHQSVRGGAGGMIQWGKVFVLERSPLVMGGQNEAYAIKRVKLSADMGETAWGCV